MAGYGLPGNYFDHPWEGEARLIQLFRRLGRGTLPLPASSNGAVTLGVHHKRHVGGRNDVCTPNVVLYGATKSFVHRFTEGLAGEYAKHGVHATVSVPGFTDTEVFLSNGVRAGSRAIQSSNWPREPDDCGTSRLRRVYERTKSCRPRAAPQAVRVACKPFARHFQICDDERALEDRTHSPG
jgi:NAD(P)-dependent dehydrogenase (short-subunit alcohol dehydrogenase family)